MEKALDFLKKNNDVAFATVENEKPKMRVFQIMKQCGTKLYFATAPHKEVYHQLRRNPFVEILSMNNNISVRADGKAEFDVSDEICREIYDNNDILQRLYHNYDDLVYFSLQIHNMDYFDLSPMPPLFYHYDKINEL